MADLEVEKQGYSGFERFMFFVTPILFTLVLLGVLVTLFNIDLRNKALEIGNSIPFLENVLPDPAVDSTQSAQDEDHLKSTNTSAKISELKTELAAKQAELTKAAAEKTMQDQQIKDLQGQVDQLKHVNDEKLLDDDQYQAKIVELASMYAQITPSKAAPILENMELPEAVLVLNAMSTDARVKVLEKMKPKTAADATMMLKDVSTAKDQAIAALQARVKKQESASEKTLTILDEAQLKATFSTMTPKSAGELLLKMADVSPSKVLRILNAVDDSSRSKIITEMSSANQAVTAQLVSKLMVGK